MLTRDAHSIRGGRVVFLSRIGEVLRLGGFLTNPAEIEARMAEKSAAKG